VNLVSENRNQNFNSNRQYIQTSEEMSSPIVQERMETSTESAELNNYIDQPLSKNAQKRLKRKELWESKRDDRKIERKRKQHEKRERDKQVKRQKYLDEHNPENATEGDGSLLSAKPKEEHIRHTSTNIHCVIDCAFDDLMSEKVHIL